MLKPENYLDHFREELWPILSKLEKERKRTKNILLFGKVYNYLGFLLIMAFILVIRGARVSIEQININVVVLIFLILFIYLPANFLVFNFLVATITINADKKRIIWKWFLRLIFIGLIVFLFLVFKYIEFKIRMTLGANFEKFILFLVAFFSIPISILITKLTPMLEENYYKLVKKEIIAKIVSSHNPFYKYNPKGYVNSNGFFRSGLFKPAFITEYSGSDLVSGETGYGHFYFSQVGLRIKSGYKKLGTLPSRQGVYFQGIIYVTDFNRKFSGKTLIYPDFARRSFGNLVGEAINKMSIFRKSDLVMLEDVEFEEEFAVYSSDQVEARYILTPTMMERLKLFKKRFDKDVYFSFTNNCMFVMVNSGYDLLIPDINKTLLNFETFTKAYETIGMLIEFTTGLSPESEAVG